MRLSAEVQAGEASSREEIVPASPFDARPGRQVSTLPAKALERRPMRVPIALAAAFLLATFSPPGTYRPAPPPAQSFVRFAPVPLDAGDPDRRRLGRLTFLGGWRLDSNDPRFGGLSSLHV